MDSLVKNLLKRIEYAKKSCLPNQSLYEAYGQIKMAHELKAINDEDFLRLNHECVAEGINNPKYFD